MSSRLYFFSSLIPAGLLAREGNREGFSDKKRKNRKRQSDVLLRTATITVIHAVRKYQVIGGAQHKEVYFVEIVAKYQSRGRTAPVRPA